MYMYCAAATKVQRIQPPAYQTVSITAVPRQSLKKPFWSDWLLRCLEKRVQLEHWRWHRDAPIHVRLFGNNAMA